jgi:hypothetical protein
MNGKKPMDLGRGAVLLLDQELAGQILSRLVKVGHEEPIPP